MAPGRGRPGSTSEQALVFSLPASCGQEGCPGAVILPPGGPLESSGDSFGCHSREEGCCWHLVGARPLDRPRPQRMF